MLQIEQNFINAQKDALNLTEYNKLSRSIETAQKKKFYTSLKLGAIIAQGIEKFKKDVNFKEDMNANGITWTLEEFMNAAYGINKSFAYKVVKAAKHEQIIVDAFEIFANENKVSLSIEELNKFAKNVGKVDEGATAEGIAEEAAEEEVSAKVLYTFVCKLDGHECNVNVKNDGSINTSSTKESLLLSLRVLSDLIQNNL